MMMTSSSRFLCLKLGHLWRSFCLLSSCLYRYILLLPVNFLLLQVLYFVSLSFLGFWVLIKTKTTSGSGSASFTTPPRSIDLFFTSVSAATVSSMSTVEMEVFSNSQLIVLTVLMFIGGEVFTSMVGLHLKQRKLKLLIFLKKKVASVSTSSSSSSSSSNDDDGLIIDSTELGLRRHSFQLNPQPDDPDYLRYLSIRFLGYLILAYLVLVHALGVALVSIYLRVVSSARNVLRRKDLKLITFSIFTTVSTFASCGFVPTNENMMLFRNNSGLLLLLIPQVLMGSTLFPCCLRFCLWLLSKYTTKKNQVIIGYLLNNNNNNNSTAPEISYLHLLPKLHSSLLAVTVFGFIGVQFVLFCAMEWTSEPLSGLTTYEKMVGVLFQCVNSRHTGETIVDLSTIASAVLVLFVVMMYLPPYTTFLPVKGNDDDDEGSSVFLERRRKPRFRGELLENIILSQLSYIVIFIILVCITEREKMKKDPLNFNVFNIVVEVISAYGNVGFTMGYSCKRQLKPDARGCTDKWFGFSGKWSDEGKIILILVMIFGRLKKFNMNGGRGWMLL